MTEPARMPDGSGPPPHEGGGTAGDGGAEALAEASRIAEVDAWCARLVDDQRAAIEHLRAQVRAIVPDATEGIHYRVPTFFLDGPLVALTVNRSALTLITMRPGLLDSMRAALRGVTWSGSTLRTALDQPFSDDVLREIVLARADQNATGT